MFRVPSNADAPTFDDTFKVGFFRWLSSKGVERIEWQRRRNMAAQTAAANQRARAEAFAQRKIAGVVAKAQADLPIRVADGRITQEQADETMRKIRESARMT